MNKVTQKTPEWPITIDDWSAKSAEKSIISLYQLTIAAAHDRITWYDNKATQKGKQSRRLRLAAIMSGTIGTLMPLIQGAGPEFEAYGVDLPSIGPLGYVFLAIAGALLFGDRAFGTSTSWIRFRLAQTQLIKLLVEFQADWAIAMNELDSKGGQSTSRNRLLELQKQFALAVEDVAEKETETWVSEFRTSLAELSRAYRKEAADESPKDAGSTKPARPRESAK